MNALNLAENIMRLRHERKITQEELADFVGVTKASVSKWESGKNTPDILLLPLLASFFDVTVDELMGYEPQLSKEQIRRIYGELCLAFVNLPFHEALERARTYARRYYSCYPFLLQLGILYLNHSMLTEREEERQEILKEADTFCDHILDRCKDVGVRDDAVSLKAMLHLQLGKTKDAIELLEDLTEPSRISEQNDMILIQAYQQAGDVERAKNHTQIRIYLNLLNLIGSETLFLALYEDFLDRCEETIERVEGIMELYHLDELHPNLAAQFYYQAAVVYGKNGRKERALIELENFENCVIGLLESPKLLLSGDTYFDRLEEWIERLPLGDMAPRDKSFAKQSALQALSHPAFLDLKENEEFQRIYSHILEGGKTNA